jgi:multimeric flavodoxin WrbA
MQPEMKKNRILVIFASPRKGNSTYAAKKFAKSLKGKKTYVDINRLEIKPCKACEKCAEKISCVYDDDAAALIRQVEAADVVIAGSPVYFTGVPGPLKIFIDRNQVKWEESQSGIRNPESGIKTGIIILTAGHKKAKYFRPAESEIRSFFAVNNIKTKLVLKFGGMDEKRAMKKYAAKIKAAAEKLEKNG